MLLKSDLDVQQTPLCFALSIDKFQLTGRNLGQVFNSRSGCVYACIHSCCYWAKLLNLKLKTRPKQLLGYLPLVFALPPIVPLLQSHLSLLKDAQTLLSSVSFTVLSELFKFLSLFNPLELWSDPCPGRLWCPGGINKGSTVCLDGTQKFDQLRPYLFWQISILGVHVKLVLLQLACGLWLHNRQGSCHIWQMMHVHEIQPDQASL